MLVSSQIDLEATMSEPNIFADPKLENKSFIYWLSYAEKKLKAQKRKCLSTVERRTLQKSAVTHSFLSSKGLGYCGLSGKRFLPCGLDFHHVVPSTKNGHISEMLSSSFNAERIEVLTKELHLCVLVSKIHHGYIHSYVKGTEFIDSVFCENTFHHNCDLLTDKIKHWKRHIK